MLVGVESKSRGILYPKIEEVFVFSETRSLQIQLDNVTYEYASGLNTKLLNAHCSSCAQRLGPPRRGIACDQKIRAIKIKYSVHNCYFCKGRRLTSP